MLKECCQNCSWQIPVLYYRAFIIHSWGYTRTSWREKFSSIRSEIGSIWVASPCRNLLEEIKGLELFGRLKPKYEKSQCLGNTDVSIEDWIVKIESLNEDDGGWWGQPLIFDRFKILYFKKVESFYMENLICQISRADPTLILRSNC